MISFLKKLRFSLKEIKAYLEKRAVEKLLELFQVWELEKKRLEK